MLSIDMKDDRSEIVHYDFEEYPVYIRKALLSSYENFEAPLHWHDDIELILALQGEMNYNINGKIVTIKQGDGIFVNSKQLHCGFSKDKSECEFICILIHPILLCISQAFECDYVLPLIKNQAVPYLYLSVENSWQSKILINILNMYNTKSDKSTVLKIFSYFLKIWDLIFSNTKAHTEKEVQNSDLTVLKNMIGFIQKSYKEKITLNDIAKAGAVGQSKCCKLFEKHIGATPNTYLIQYRLHQSTWYLKNTNMTITQIAHAVGFSGSSYFAETFKKRYGKTPSEYKRQALSVDFMKG